MEKEDVDELRCNLKDLANFAECDFKGRICSDLDANLFQIELFREQAENLQCYNVPYPFINDWSRLHYFKNDNVFEGSAIYPPNGPWLTLMCGLPGSGKNTWIKNNSNGEKIIELDAIRKSLKISPTNKKEQGKVIQFAKMN